MSACWKLVTRTTRRGLSESTVSTCHFSILSWATLAQLVDLVEEGRFAPTLLQCQIQTLLTNICHKCNTFYTIIDELEN